MEIRRTQSRAGCWSIHRTMYSWTISAECFGADWMCEVYHPLSISSIFSQSSPVIIKIQFRTELAWNYLQHSFCIYCTQAFSTLNAFTCLSAGCVTLVPYCKGRKNAQSLFFLQDMHTAHCAHALSFSQASGIKVLMICFPRYEETCLKSNSTNNVMVIIHINLGCSVHFRNIIPK